jgi:hypothetical protein
MMMMMMMPLDDRGGYTDDDFTFEDFQHFLLVLYVCN